MRSISECEIWFMSKRWTKQNNGSTIPKHKENNICPCPLEENTKLFATFFMFVDQLSRCYQSNSQTRLVLSDGKKWFKDWILILLVLPFNTFQA